jgi:arylsulfatase
VSLLSTFGDPKAPEKHTTQYFEMMGHRSLYHDGWRAVCPWPGTSFKESGRTFGTPITYDMLTQLDAKGWELYNVKADFAETNNLAEKEKDRLIAMIGMWYTEAGKYNVLPIDSRGLQRVREERPQIAVSRERYVLYPGTQSIPAGAAPRILNRPYSMTAEVDVPGAGAEGVLLSFGGSDGGISFYMQNGRLCFAHNYVATEYFYVKSKSPVPSGHHFLSMQFTPTGAPDFAKGKGSPGIVKLLVDGKEIGVGELSVTSPNRLAQGGAMLVGADAGAAVVPEYQSPFRFAGTIKRVIVDVSGEHVEDYEAQMRIVLASQ